jgi:octaprenyl-diphosphate synthase
LDNIAIANELIQCAEMLIEGEFNQIKIKSDKTISVVQYYDVIEKKTAVLFSGILKCLGIEVCLSDEDQDQLKQLGLAYGRAFQINDDLNDFKESQLTGKAEFKDLSEGKLTLPVIFLLETVNAEQQKEILQLITTQEYNAVKELLENSNSFALARAERDKAISDCIEYTERFIKLDRLEKLRVFLEKTLIA